MPEFRPGDPFGMATPRGELILDAPAAAIMNDALATLRRLGRLTGVAPLTIADDGGGRRLALDLPTEVWAQLSGSTSPYSFTEQAWTGTAWSAVAGGYSGSDAYEANSLGGLGGKVVRLRRSRVGDWRFQYGSLKTSGGGGCGNVCVLVTDCFNGNAISDATFTLSQGGTTVGTCTTADGQVSQTIKVSGGSGYTSAPTVTFSGGGATTQATGTALIATFGALAGQVTGINLVNHGSGYTSAPTITFSGGGGTGANFTAKIAGACCIPYAASGSYTLSVARAGYVTQTATLSATCPANVYQSMALVPTTGTLTAYVEGCNVGQPYVGGTVQVKQGTTVVASGTTDGTGHFSWAGAQNGVAYTVSVTAIDPTRWITGTITAGPTTFNACAPWTPMLQFSQTPGPATGYYCVCCQDPLPGTVHLSSAIFGTATLTYDPTNGGAWNGSSPAVPLPSAVASCTSCPAGKTVSATWFFYGCTLGYTFTLTDINGCTAASSSCGQSRGFGTSPLTPTSTTCSPFAIQFAPNLGGLAQFGGCSYPDSVTITE